jgi:hypothetical protein
LQDHGDQAGHHDRTKNKDKEENETLDDIEQNEGGLRVEDSAKNVKPYEGHRKREAKRHATSAYPPCP